MDALETQVYNLGYFVGNVANAYDKKYKALAEAAKVINRQDLYKRFNLLRAYQAGLYMARKNYFGHGQQLDNFIESRMRILRKRVTRPRDASVV